jgi:hypothetical protein
MKTIVLVPFALSLAACATSVDGDQGGGYGAVTVTVAFTDGAGQAGAPDVRQGPGDELVAPLDRDLFDPVTVDGVSVADPVGLLDATSASIETSRGAVIALGREGGELRADGPTLLDIQSVRRSGDTLLVTVAGGRFEIGVTGELSAESRDRFLATALVRLVRGEALLARDCRPDCIYDLDPSSWVCGPMRGTLERAFGGDCAGPFTSEEWASLEAQLRGEERTRTCYDLWWIPRPICEWAYDFAAGSVLDNLEPDASGMVCASAFYAACTGEVAECTAPE